MAGRKSDFTLTRLDDLFSTQEQRDEEKLSKIRDIPLELIDDFPDHPFKVRDDEDMQQLVESIKERGVITPATVRQKEDGRYELISGHRRKRACELAGFDTLRCEVVDLNRDEATILMVESNFQRSQILPSEKAYAYKMRLDAMNRQGQRTDLTSTPLVSKSRTNEELGNQVGESREQIRRYVRLTNLVPELLEFVDEGRIKMREKTKVYMVDFPRDGDANYDGVWGHSNLTLKNGWHTGSSTHTNLKAIGSYSGNIAYCIEPGVSLSSGQSMNKYDENYFNNITANGVISGDEIRLFIGRILQYGYRGTISTSWRSQNESAANSIAHAYATQLLIWETVVGERDANFNHKAASGCSNVKDVINAKHPLRSKIMSYYNSMVSSVQNHTVVPSFCTKSSGSAKVNELEWNGSKYVATLTDSNGVLSNYDFKANISGVAFSTSGNKLTVSMDKAPSKEFTITASKKNGVRRGVVVWSEGKHGQNSSVQDVVTYAQEVSDPVTGYVKMKVSYGSCQIVKTSEDGKVDGINFTISGNGVNQTVTTANGGKFQIDNLMPGVYTVTEQSIDKYVPQEVHRVTVVAGQVATVNFNNVLKRGNLQVIKSSEDNLVEGVKFHLYGTSLAGIAVDEYAVTDKNGVATFKDVLISGSTPYTLEEVDTAIRYVVPEKQTAHILY